MNTANTIQPQIAEAEALVQQKNFQEAIEKYEYLRVSHPGDQDVIKALSRVYSLAGNGFHDIGDTDKALEYQNKAIALDPDNERAYNNRGRVYLYKEDFGVAEADFAKALSLKGDEPIFFNNHGTAFYDLAKYAEAIQEYSRAIQLNPTESEYVNNRGDCWYSTGEYEKAIADYTRAIELNPSNYLPYYNRAICYSDQEEYATAIIDYSKAVELKPDDPEIGRNLAITYFNAKKYDEAMNECNRMMTLYTQPGVTASDPAREKEIKTSMADLLNFRGVIWHNKREYEKAIADLNQSILLKDDEVDPYMNLGLSLYKLGELELAAESYQKALKLAPENPFVHHNLYHLYYKRGLYTEASASLQEAKKFYLEAIPT